MGSTPHDRVGAVLCRDARRYQVLSHLRDGRHGPIYTIRDADGKVLVAKCFPATSPGRVAFAREARALEALRHPNVIRLLDTLSDEDAQWLIFEACSTNLGVWLARIGRGAARYFPHVALGMLQAVDHMHRRGFVHCDIRPRNILLAAPDKARRTGAPIVKLADFGDSVMLSACEPGNSSALSGGGWIHPPEIEYPGRFGNPDHRIDLFHCALVLLSLLRGKPVNLTTEQVVQGEALALLHEFDESWTRPLERALDSYPGNRHASALDLWKDLHRVFDKSI